MSTIKFAVTREDPRIEQSLLDHGACALLVASGGCTLWSLRHHRPDLQLEAYDINPAQLAWAQSRPTDPSSTQCGAFEGLFRLLRITLSTFVVGDDGWVEWFAEPDPTLRHATLLRWMADPYWPVAFELAFSNPLLHTMFGTAATQHAEPGSYPTYFQTAFERGLSVLDAPGNPFLQHVLLGRYLDPPPWLALPRDASTIRWHACTLPEIDGLERFDLISVSNIFDWSDDETVHAWAGHLTQHGRPGVRVLLRQLNNTRAMEPFFGPRWSFDDELETQLLARDRSLFYNRIRVATLT